MRAVFDRFLETGAFTLPAGDQATVDELKKDSKYGAFGTCCHFELQDGLRCVWPTGKSEDYKYTPEEFKTASLMHGGNADRTLEMIRRVARYAAPFVPKPADGKPWLCEHKFGNPFLTGTIDFLSQDGLEIGDLKTTTKPPVNRRAKYAHVIQMVCYHILVPSAKRGWILYVDSLAASWSTLVPIDYQSAEMQELEAQVVAYAKHLRSVNLPKSAIPRMGSHCEDNFCPYRRVCHDRYRPDAGTAHEAKLAVGAGSLNPFQSALGVKP